jgi:hypothetical protein
MTRSYPFLRPFLEPGPVPALFIMGVILLSLIGNAIYEGLRTIFHTPLSVLLVALALLALLIVFYALLRYLLEPGLTVRDVQPKRGLVTLVSNGKVSELSAAAAIRYHYCGERDDRSVPTLQHCWLITSPRSLAADNDRDGITDEEIVWPAWKNAQGLREKYHGLIKMRILEVDPEDPQSVFAAIETAYREARQVGLRPHEVAADCTGGNKVMTVGMALACASANRRLTYMKPRRVNDKGIAMAKFGSVPKLLDLHFFLRTPEHAAGGD